MKKSNMKPEEFKALRDKAGMTREEMATALGVSFFAVYSYETGRRSILERTVKDLREIMAKKSIKF